MDILNHDDFRQLSAVVSQHEIHDKRVGFARHIRQHAGSAAHGYPEKQLGFHTGTKNPNTSSNIQTDS
jgi:hypothetical protein